MTKREILYIEETLSVLIGQPMHSLERIGPNLAANFGELIEIDTIKLGEDRRPVRDKNGRGIPTKRMEGKHVLESLCSSRFTCGDDIVFAKSDMFLPNDEIANRPDFVWDTFEWHVYGNNYFDRIVAKHFNGDFSNYIVKSVKANKFGDLTIEFENSFVLELFADGSGYSENWSFGEINSSKPLIAVTGNGIDTE